MTKKKIYIDAGMVLGGIVLLFVLKGESWSPAKYFFFYICSGIGSVIGLNFSRGFFKSFIISVLSSALLLFLGLTIADISVEGISVLSGYVMWLPLIILLLPLYGLAGTLSTYPIVRVIVKRINKKG
jgi:ABC-type Fe3+ transport system permease subunit